MNLKHARFAPIALLMAFLMVGCPETSNTDEDTSTGDATEMDTNMGDTGGEDTASSCSLPEGCLDYQFIRVDDMSDNPTGDNPGADIDAVILVQADGTRVFANSAPQYMAAELVEASDPNEAIGAPDAFESYPTDTAMCGLYKDQTACENDGTCEPTYASLGGMGGYLIVGMPNAIVEGDTIEVLEVGNCEFPSADNPGTTGNAPAEEIQIQVSVSDAPDGSWVVVSESGTGPVISGTVPSLPEVSAGN